MEGRLWKILGRGMNTECEAGMGLTECITHSGGKCIYQAQIIRTYYYKKVTMMLLIYIEYRNNKLNV